MDSAMTGGSSNFGTIVAISTGLTCSSRLRLFRYLSALLCPRIGKGPGPARRPARFIQPR